MDSATESAVPTEQQQALAASVSADDPGFHLGQRVHTAGNPRRIGTVRYVGPVDGYAGPWIGVDWDDGEGKHDGSIAGIRYFAARGERSGSLVRPKNLSAGISLIEALLLRYRGGESTKEEEDEMYVFSTSKRRVSIKLVGTHKVQEKLNHFEELLRASVSNLGVGSVGSPHDIHTLVPNLKELDLTGNLLSKWQEVASLCVALPALEILNLTSNLMESDIAELPQLKSIRVFVLNNCGISWKHIEKLEQSLPAVEELHLMGNELRTVTSAPVPGKMFVQGFNTLHLLNLEGNCIDSWDEILKLSNLRSLEELYLNKNSLKNVYFPATCPESQNSCELKDGCFRPFENLQCLLLGGNEIDDLASVDSLNSFPKLTDIRLSENPIADPAKGGVQRFILVARLAKVKTLNGSEVSPRERKDSEIRYVRLVMAQMQSVSPEKIKLLHPRYAELKAAYGIDDEKPSSGPAGPQKMASGLLCITLKCVGASMGEKLPLTKKLPPTTTVGKLKGLCESFFKLKGIRPRLFIQEEGSPREWNIYTMISGYSQNGLPNESLSIFRQMQQVGHTPSTIAITGALTACAQLSSMRLGKEALCIESKLHQRYVREQLNHRHVCQVWLYKAIPQFLRHVEDKMMLFHGMKWSRVMAFTGLGPMQSNSLIGCKKRG